MHSLSHIKLYLQIHNTSITKLILFFFQNTVSQEPVNTQQQEFMEISINNLEDYNGSVKSNQSNPISQPASHFTVIETAKVYPQGVYDSKSYSSNIKNLQPALITPTEEQPESNLQNLSLAENILPEQEPKTLPQNPVYDNKDTLEKIKERQRYFANKKKYHHNKNRSNSSISHSQYRKTKRTERPRPLSISALPEHTENNSTQLTLSSEDSLAFLQSLENLAAPKLTAEDIPIPDPDYLTQDVKPSIPKDKEVSGIIKPREFKGPYGMEDLDEMNNPLTIAIRSRSKRFNLKQGELR